MAAIATPHGSAHDGNPGLIARYHNLADARGAIRTLEAKGVDGDDIALLGESAHTHEETDHGKVDRRILASVSLALFVGIVGGALVGGVIGLVVMTIAVLAFDFDSSGWVFGLMVGWFAAAGALFGSLASVMRALGFSESLPLTFEDDPGAPVWLAVYGDTERVRPGVESTEPVEIVTDAVFTAHPDEPEVRAS